MYNRNKKTMKTRIYHICNNLPSFTKSAEDQALWGTTKTGI